MTLHAQTFGHEAAATQAATEAAQSLSCSVKAVYKRIAVWVQTCADYWAAAALYDSLRGLSNAELHKRGLSRDTLAHHACQSCDRTMGG